MIGGVNSWLAAELGQLCPSVRLGELWGGRAGSSLTRCSMAEAEPEEVSSTQA